MEELKLQVYTLLEEEELSVNDLPQEIKNKMNGLRMLHSRYKKDPKQNIYETLLQNDIKICDMIQDWLDEEVEDEEPEAPQAPKAPIVPQVPQAPQAPKPTQTPPANTPPTQQVSAEERVANHIIQLLSGNRITTAKLTEILGSKPNFPEHKIGSLKLRRVYLNSSLYERVK
jgi:hypothetical protein